MNDGSFDDMRKDITLSMLTTPGNMIMRRGEECCRSQISDNV